MKQIDRQQDVEGHVRGASPTSRGHRGHLLKQVTDEPEDTEGHVRWGVTDEDEDTEGHVQPPRDIDIER